MTQRARTQDPYKSRYAPVSRKNLGYDGLTSILFVLEAYHIGQGLSQKSQWY